MRNGLAVPLKNKFPLSHGRTKCPPVYFLFNLFTLVKK